jgi:hypothetical protein
MTVVRVKAGAGFPVLASAGVAILAAVHDATPALGRDLTITSGSEGRGRAATDPHMTGEAADISVAGLTPGEIVKLKAALEARLGPLFTVLYETPTRPLDTALARVAYVNVAATGAHLHIQRKKNTVYPPTADQETR